MNDAAEFAQEYSKAERIRFLVFGVCAGASLMLASKFWLLPWLRAFVASPPCREVMGVSGLTVLWYGLFVGVPLLGAAVVFAIMGCRGYKVLRDGQVPPVGEKVFRPTRIKRGRAARLAGWAHLLAFVPFLMLAGWGSGQAGALSTQAPRQASRCAAGSSEMERDHTVLRVLGFLRTERGGGLAEAAALRMAPQTP